MFHWNNIVRHVFNYLIVYRVLGLKDFDKLEQLHARDDTELENETVMLSVNERIAGIAESAGDPQAFQNRYPEDLWAYREKGFAEFTTIRDEEYPKWLVTAHQPLEDATTPYPDIKVESIFDKVEKTIEEW
jgi:hypothetical protein